MKSSRYGRWLALTALLLIIVGTALPGASQPTSGGLQSRSSQFEYPLEITTQDESDALDSEDEIALHLELEALDEMEDLPAILAYAQPMMTPADTEPMKLARQNRLLLLINRLGLSREQLAQLKTITGDLIRARDDYRVARTNHQKELNDFLLKFQGSHEDLQRGLEPLRQAGRDLHRGFLEKVAGAEKTVKQSLTWEQGEKLTRAVRRGGAILLRRHAPGQTLAPGHGARLFRFGGPPRLEIREEIRVQLQKHLNTLRHWMQGRRMPGQPQQPMMPGMQPPREPLPSIGPIGHFMLRHLDALDEALAAKLAAVGQ
jgi:hypothetical protein